MNMRDPKKVIIMRVSLLYAFMLVWGIVIIGRIAYIQIHKTDELLEKARQQEIRAFDIEAMRGNILAYDGTLLLTTVPVFEVRMDVSSPLITDEQFTSAIDSLSIGLANVLKNKSAAAFKQLLQEGRKNGNRYLLLKKNVTYGEVKRLRTLPILKGGKYKGGLILEPGSKRERPYKELAQRTIGYENKVENISVGLEGAYYDYIKGTDGKQVKRRINNGDWKPLFDESTIEPQNGYDIVTTIDINIQDVAESALRRNLKENNADQGCAILMEVETGHIVAIANLSLNKKTGTYHEVYNFGIGESVEPGSTFKLASILALLDDKKINISDSMAIGNGHMKFHTRVMKDVYPIRDGRISVQEAFEKSSNVAIAKMVTDAYKNEPEKFIEKLYGMGLNKQLGIEIAGEGKPYIKHPSDKKYWYGTSLPWMSIGYELQITPLQLLTLYNAVANNGKMMKPLFVKEIRQGNTVIEARQPVVLNKSIASADAIKKARYLLEGVVENGTARSLKDSPFRIAGKTGTAQIASPEHGYNKKNYNASFAGYFPAGNPKYSCIVFVNNPSSGKIYGGAVAAPVFKEIAAKVYASRPHIHDNVVSDDTYLAGMPQINCVSNAADLSKLFQLFGVSSSPQPQTAAWGIPVINENNRIEYDYVQLQEKVMPDVTGMNVRDAIYLLESIGLAPRVSGKGKVVAQSIEPGITVEKGQKIDLKLLNL